jgi:hypothetical protein
MAERLDLLVRHIHKAVAQGKLFVVLMDSLSFSSCQYRLFLINIDTWRKARFYTKTDFQLSMLSIRIDDNTIFCGNLDTPDFSNSESCFFYA